MSLAAVVFVQESLGTENRNKYRLVSLTVSAALSLSDALI